MDRDPDRRIFDRSWNPFNKTTKEEKVIKEKIKKEVLVSCAPQLQKLQNCYRSSVFGFCYEETSTFWNCFRKVHKN